MQLKPQKFIISVSIVLTGILISTPSHAFSLPILNFVQSIIDDVRNEYRQLEQQVQQKIDSSWADIKNDAREAIQNSMGSMGTPDPVSSGEDLKQRLRNSRSLPEAKNLAQDLERDLTRASVSSVVGVNGQQDTERKIQATTQIAQEAQNLAQQAQNMDASQNILKVIAAQNAQMVSAITRLHADSLASRQDTAQSNLMLAQIADNLASTREKENLRITGQATLTQELVFMSVLDPARN
ncbi:hypothetical protein IQ243_19105 [Nostocales cyanobacterium LEGE 11386]|nr:hypothetical protein [Nostocales cyanobacterium LEGE 11386]